MAPPGDNYPQFLYEECYEQVAAFLLPQSALEELTGTALPPPLSYRTTAGTDPGLVQLNVGGLDCRQGQQRVVDLLLNVPVNVPANISDGLPTLWRIRTYTNSPQTLARYAQGWFCFDDNVSLAQLDADVRTENNGLTSGRVLADDGHSTVVLTTTVPSTTPPTPVAAATLRHVSLDNGMVHGAIDWGAGPAQGQRTPRPIPDSMPIRLIIDGAQPQGLQAIGAQHAFALEDQTLTFFHRGQGPCPPAENG